MEPEMSDTPLCSQKVRVDALAIIPDPLSKLPLVIAQFHFNLLRLGMSECIAQGLARDLVDFVTHDRVQSARCACDTTCNPTDVCLLASAASSWPKVVMA